MYYSRNNTYRYGGNFQNYNMPPSKKPVSAVPRPVSGGYDENFTIAMAYVPWQIYRDLYEPCDALCQGTVFKELNLVFCG